MVDSRERLVVGTGQDGMGPEYVSSVEDPSGRQVEEAG
jgi:hypothetical protein